jgi:DNA polymerase-3 subunit delta'
VLLIAPTGSGKGAVAKLLAGQLLQLPEQKLANSPHFKHLIPNSNKGISVDDIREVIHFTTLRSTAVTSINRVIVIEDSQQMTAQAQNALLKTLEEPPAGTIMILTAPSELSLLPTIRSRLQLLTLPTIDNLTTVDYFKAQGYQLSVIERALLMSGGLLGLMHALLEEDNEHPLVRATKIAHDLLEQTTFNRLAGIENLAKDRQLCSDVLFILAQMASIALGHDQTNLKVLQKWQRILTASHTASSQLLANAQTKLVLLNFMLAL